jgi:hypothetical protein
MGKMKYLPWIFLATVFAVPLWATGPDAAGALSDQDRRLVFSPAFLKTDDAGNGYLLVQGEPLSVGRLLSLSPWDLMDLVQRLSGTPVPLSRFGDGDEVTQAWRTKVATFAASGNARQPATQEDLFDPNLVLWDPGYIQNLNSWGKWTIRIDRRDLEQEDLATLSPLEVQQAVEVLTGRTYTTEFILDHLEAFRAQLSVVPRLTEAAVGDRP